MAAGPSGDADGDAWRDVAVARVRLGRLQTPWLASGALSLDGVRHALGGPGRRRATRVADRADGCKFVLPGWGLSVRGTVTAVARTSWAGLCRPGRRQPRHRQPLDGDDAGDGAAPRTPTPVAGLPWWCGLPTRDARARPRHPRAAVPGRPSHPPRRARTGRAAGQQPEWGMMEGQARWSGLVMGFDTHMIAGNRACCIQLDPLTRPSPTRQARTMTRPWPRPRHDNSYGNFDTFPIRQRSYTVQHARLRGG
jgi:hypothetical protein